MIQALNILALFWFVRFTISYIQIDVIEYASHTGNKVVLNETGPFSSVVIEVSTKHLNENTVTTLEICSVDNSSVLIVFDERDMSVDCNENADYVLFNSSSAEEFYVCDTGLTINFEASRIYYYPDVYLTLVRGNLSKNRLEFSFVATVARQNDSCHPGDFQCADGFCVWSGFKCDGINNCGDGSDEFLEMPAQCTSDDSYRQLNVIVLICLALLVILTLIVSYFVYSYMAKLKKGNLSSDSLNGRQEQPVSRTGSVATDVNDAELSKKSSTLFPAFAANPNEKADEEQQNGSSSLERMKSGSLSSKQSVTEMRDISTDAHNLYLKKRQLIAAMTMSGAAISELAKVTSEIDKRDDEYIKGLSEFTSSEHEEKDTESIQENRDDSHVHADDTSELVFEGSDSCDICVDESHE
ncbi:hypothetical protein AVEN_235772-1 [Araneus ventricosus]|uniref:CUB domain-containing protein n=1 Tax=Araneus ventricosus TaxID=182803 RepID=A0A4Y2LEV3_ARAVE|nr:hypothetical protein AVEN_235772-1 [Araneus ventricosus]